MDWGWGALSTERDTKFARLEAWLKDAGSVLVAFSGGVDSTYLAAMTYKALGDRALAVTADSPSIPRSDLQGAGELAKQIGIRHRVIEAKEMENPAYVRNEPDRCYHCKAELFGLLEKIAKEEDFAVVVDGANAEDIGDYRPGSRAARERGVRSPLQELGFTKEDVRAGSRELGLPTADRPASACLASRVPYGTGISVETLRMIESAEAGLREMGFAVVRVRAHGDVARLEFSPKDIPRAMESELRQRIAEHVRACGFRYVAVDLEGYRTGSLNEGLRR
jgi:uncharacterized protein